MQNSVSPPQSFLNLSLAKKKGNCCEARSIVFSIGVFVSLTDGFDFLWKSRPHTHNSFVSGTAKHHLPNPLASYWIKSNSGENTDQPLDKSLARAIKIKSKRLLRLLVVFICILVIISRLFEMGTIICSMWSITFVTWPFRLSLWGRWPGHRCQGCQQSTLRFLNCFSGR